MIIKYYYLRNSKNEPRLTRCIIKKEDEIAIGTSLCSPSDSPRKEDGRNKAFGRAMSALYKKDNVFPILRNEALQVLEDVRADDIDYYYDQLVDRDYKGLYVKDLSVLNSFEQKLLNIKES